eukprot:1807443-Prymnesium_polylepis.1
MWSVSSSLRPPIDAARPWHRRPCTVKMPQPTCAAAPGRARAQCSTVSGCDAIHCLDPAAASSDRCESAAALSAALQSRCGRAHQRRRHRVPRCRDGVWCSVRWEFVQHSRGLLKTAPPHPFTVRARWRGAPAGADAHIAVPLALA